MRGSRILERGRVAAGVGLAVAGLTVFTGCRDTGRGGVEVCGTVTLDGRPMPAGSVVFVPLGGGHKAVAEIVVGEFRIPETDGPVPGAYRIEIYAPERSEVPLDDPVAYARGAPRVPPPNPVAAAFNTDSALRRTVTAAGENAFTFQVESARRIATGH